MQALLSPLQQTKCVSQTLYLALAAMYMLHSASHRACNCPRCCSLSGSVGLVLHDCAISGKVRFFGLCQLTGQAAAFRRMSMWQEKDLGIICCRVSQGLAAWRRQ